MSLNNSMPFTPSLWFSKFNFIGTEEQETIPKSYKKKKQQKDYTVSQFLSAVYASAEVQSVWEWFCFIFRRKSDQKRLSLQDLLSSGTSFGPWY